MLNTKIISPFLLGSVIFLTSVGAGCSATTTPSVPSFDWNTRARIDIGQELTIAGCPGDAPLACIYKEDEVQALIELLQYPKNPDETVTLEERARDYYKNIEEDRKIGCPAGYRVITEPLHTTAIATMPGIKTELLVIKPDQTLVEQYLTYFTQSSDKLWVFAVSAYEAGSCVSAEGGGSITNLEAVKTAVDRVVATSILPQAAYDQ